MKYIGDINEKVAKMLERELTSASFNSFVKDAIESAYIDEDNNIIMEIDVEMSTEVLETKKTLSVDDLKRERKAKHQKWLDHYKANP